MSPLCLTIPNQIYRPKRRSHRGKNYCLAKVFHFSIQHQNLEKPIKFITIANSSRAVRLEELISCACSRIKMSMVNFLSELMEAKNIAPSSINIIDDNATNSNRAALRPCVSSPSGLDSFRKAQCRWSKFQRQDSDSSLMVPSRDKLCNSIETGLGKNARCSSESSLVMPTRLRSPETEPKPKTPSLRCQQVDTKNAKWESGAVTRALFQEKVAESLLLGLDQELLGALLINQNKRRDLQTIEKIPQAPSEVLSKKVASQNLTVAVSGHGTLTRSKDSLLLLGQARSKSHGERSRATSSTVNSGSTTSRSLRAALGGMAPSGSSSRVQNAQSSINSSTTFKSYKQVSKSALLPNDGRMPKESRITPEGPAYSRTIRNFPISA